MNELEILSGEIEQLYNDIDMILVKTNISVKKWKQLDDLFQLMIMKQIDYEKKTGGIAPPSD